MVSVVSPFAKYVFEIVIHALQRHHHVGVSNHPVPSGTFAPVVVRAVLEEHADRFWLRTSDQVWVPMAPADVGETADVTDDFAELIGAIPSHGKGADAPAADAANGVSFGIVPVTSNGSVS